MNKKHDTMTELLRAALRDCGSIRAVSMATGLERGTLQRFRDGRTSMRLDLADILAEYFGVECRRRKGR